MAQQAYSGTSCYLKNTKLAVVRTLYMSIILLTGKQFATVPRQRKNAISFLDEEARN